MPTYDLSCDCQAVRVRLTGEPVVRAFCHCTHCRDLNNVAVNALTAWRKDALSVLAGEDELMGFQLPSVETPLQRHFCRQCGATVFGVNRFDLRVVSQSLFRKQRQGQLPEELRPTRHIFYRNRTLDVADELPKFLDGTDGPLDDGSHVRIY